MRKLLLNDLTSLSERDNFKTIEDYIAGESLLRGEFKHFIISVNSAETQFQFPHNLGYTPKDLLVTSVIGSGAVTWHYELFDATHLVFTTTGAVTIRLFAGSYR